MQEGCDVFFREKRQMFDKLLSGMSNGTVGCELSINESTIYVSRVSFKQKYTQSKIRCRSVGENVMSDSSQEPHPVCPLEGDSSVLAIFVSTVTL